MDKKDIRPVFRLKGSAEVEPPPPMDELRREPIFPGSLIGSRFSLSFPFPPLLSSRFSPLDAGYVLCLLDALAGLFGAYQFSRDVFGLFYAQGLNAGLLHVAFCLETARHPHVLL